MTTSPGDHGPSAEPDKAPATSGASRFGASSPMLLLVVQLLPLIVFIVVDAFVTDVRISIAAAVLFAVGQLAITWVHSRRFEWLVLVDVALIAALGGISIAFQNPLFFKVKPAVVEGVATLFFGAMLLASPAFLTRYFGRMLPGRTLRPEAVTLLRTMLAVISVCTLVHIGAVLYTAFLSTKQVWALVSGPGFYVLVIPATLVVALRARRAARRGPDPTQAFRGPRKRIRKSPG